jgi:trehalose 6-phosphate phosphatase
MSASCAPMEATVDALERLMADPSRTGILSDFDGTLAAIVERPELAEPVDGAGQVLARLAASFGLVAVISGRSLEDLTARFAPEGVVLAASYGRQRSDRRALSPLRLERWDEVLAAAREACARLDGVLVEPKEAGVALHYRLGPQHASTVHRIAADLAGRFALEVQPGRMVAEIVAPGPGKAEALRELVSDAGLQSFFYAGDDLSDLDAFDWARSSGSRCVLCAVVSEEGPKELADVADLVFTAPGEVVAFLEQLVSGVS